MLKRLFKIGMLAGAMLFACNANAQTTEYPHYGFWSNWSIGGELIYNWECAQGTPFEWRVASNAGLGILFEKELNYVWDARFSFVLPGLWKGLNTDPEGDHYDRYGKFGLDMKFSLNNAIKGYYDPDRKGNLYLLAGAGVAGDFTPFGLGAAYLQAGLGFSYQCGQHSTWFIEWDQDFIADIPGMFMADPANWHNTNGSLVLGWMYNFGPTQKDLDMIAQKSCVTREELDAKNSEIEGLRNDLRDSKAREAKLINRINELEANKPTTNIVKKDDGVADSLRKVIEGYENNKHNFYALPFSILYGVDEYTVSEDQMNKVKAIAQIMKDNDCDFEIIGYCDYSGSDAYNQKLSEKRAENVKKLLVNKYGVDGDRLTVSGKGKTMSFGDIKNAVNRRVSFYRTNK